jgi:dTDP-4-dehydrorhamnose 3,5-epimerase
MPLYIFSSRRYKAPTYEKLYRKISITLFVNHSSEKGTSLKVTKCSLDGVLLIEPAMFTDDRGFFLESYQEERYCEVGVTENFVQDNHSRSMKHVLRGLHFTKNRPQAQILTVMRGKIFDVVVDIRNGSPTFGQWFGAELSDGNIRQIYMPHGFAHGFCVLSDFADLHYKVSQPYDATDEGGLCWNDPEIGISWKTKSPIISERDSCHPLLAELNLNES